jgi:lysozyme
MNAVQLCTARLTVEEGVRRKAYDDSTGKTVTCKPAGNLSIGVGINLEVGLDDDEIAWLTSHRLGIVEISLAQRSFYQGLDDVRRSVLLEIGFNAGVPGLLGFRNMLQAVDARNWPRAHDELLDSDAARQLPARYSRLAMFLLTGVT